MYLMEALREHPSGILDPQPLTKNSGSFRLDASVSL